MCYAKIGESTTTTVWKGIRFARISRAPCQCSALLCGRWLDISLWTLWQHGWRSKLRWFSSTRLFRRYVHRRWRWWIVTSSIDDRRNRITLNQLQVRKRIARVCTIRAAFLCGLASMLMSMLFSIQLRRLFSRITAEIIKLFAFTTSTTEIFPTAWALQGAVLK